MLFIIGVTLFIGGLAVIIADYACDLNLVSDRGVQWVTWTIGAGVACLAIDTAIDLHAILT